MQKNNLLTRQHKDLFTVVANEKECIQLIGNQHVETQNRLDTLYWQK